jgi:signal transduction histidine kinase
VKNLVSQLSLVARNAERHADNPAFRADMVATLQSSVGKLNDLLARLSPRVATRADAPIEQVDLADLLQQVTAVKRLSHSALTLDMGPAESSGRDFVVNGDSGRIEQLLLHLVQNAIDASAADAPIIVSAHRGDNSITITIRDNGSGMSQRFIAQELFKPFRSTKPGGFGIGAYEAREIARSHNGRLEVESREGEGSVFRIVLPAAEAALATAAQ